eukprot:GHVU01091076.1.p1 GENE.GHVU01091076.1~~GHVU01091076.1.p1  ORF type:complete len:237 (+),score=43.35 GHVU01091076.1:53-763(+)
MFYIHVRRQWYRSMMADGPRKVFSEEQIMRYKRIFNLFDINKNGVIEAKELAAAAKVLGYKLPKEQLMKILQHFDLSENGTLSFDAFLEAMPGNTESIPEIEHQRAEFRQAFMEYDLDHNGFITKEEAYTVLQKELGMNESKSHAMLVQFDINEDGKLAYEEFVAFYSKVKDKKVQIEKAFHEFDKEGKGHVTVADAQRILGAIFSDTEVEQLVRLHDANQDGVLQFNEFISFWGS